ncbi:hypothetical protein [Burkholderia pseudomallei]|uniref:hypothetical protein n=1 Tax=Burkholderia pseudomallei TaxID=28450 RepID=UPI0009CB9057|nr:hypothetical protein [Burkholderia pseudomallei]ONA11308.1 hypothetical protein AQ876_04715 [Burkholderia pseudomallei]
MNDQQQSRADALTKLVESYGHALIKQRSEEASAILEMIHGFAASSAEHPAAAPIIPTPADKRAAFEAWWTRDVPIEYRSMLPLLLQRNAKGEYDNPRCEGAWEIWQASAAASPAASEPLGWIAEGIDGYSKPTHYMNKDESMVRAYAGRLFGKMTVRPLSYADAPMVPGADAVAWVRKHPDTGALSGDWLWNDAIEQCRKDSGVWFPLGFLGARPALPEEPAAIHQVIHQVWVEETSSWTDVTPAYYAERQPSNRRRVYYAPQPAQAAFDEVACRTQCDVCPGSPETGGDWPCARKLADQQPAQADAPAHATECPHCDGEGVIEADSGASPCACAQDAQEGMPTFGARRTQADAPAEAREPNQIYVEVRQCDRCDHIGINDGHATDAACGYPCGWSGPSPVEDKCPGCGHENVMSVACPKCSGHYSLLANGLFETNEVSEPAEAREPIAWVTDDDRAITAAQKQRALADGGATASSVRPYSIPCYAVSAPADAGEAVAHMRVRSTDAGSTRHAIDIAPEAAALDLKPGEYLLYLAPPTTRAAHLTTTLSPDQRISMAAKLFCFANELLNGADQS